MTTDIEADRLPIPTAPRRTWAAARRLRRCVATALALGSVLSVLEGAPRDSTSVSTPSDPVRGAVTPTGDSAFEAPPFPRTPLLVPRASARRWVVSRAELSYRRLGGDEIGGWYADLYVPREASEEPPNGRAAVDRSSAPPQSAPVAAAPKTAPPTTASQTAPAAATSRTDPHTTAPQTAPSTTVSQPAPAAIASQTDPSATATRASAPAVAPHVDTPGAKTQVGPPPATPEMGPPPGAPPTGPPSAAPQTPRPVGRPLVIVLPIGGGTHVAERFTRLFAGEGFAVLNLLRPPETAERVVLHSLRGTEKGLVEDTANLRRVIAWARSLSGIDPARVGVLGVSRGAIVTALAAELDPTLRTVLVIGGADLPGLFRDSRLSLVEKLRKAELARANGGMEKALGRARAILANVDPLTRMGRIDPASTFLINAKYDHVVPRAEALALREAAGGAAQVWLPTGHYGTLLYAGRVRRLALDHFRRTLRPESRARITGGR